MSRVPTYCRICEPQCALIAELDPDTRQVVRLQPDKAHPVHKGFACHKGLNFVELHHDPDRLNHPRERRNSKSASKPVFETVGWDAAVGGIAERINDLQTRYGSDALGFYIGNPSAFNSTGREAARQFARAIGAKYTFGSGTQDCSNKFATAEAVYGTANLHPIPDYKDTHFLLSIGSNPRISHASFVHMSDPMGAIRDIVKRGGKVVHVNPRKIESAGPASGDVLQIKPDSDPYLLAAMLNTMRAESLVDEAWIEQHSRNAELLWDFISAYTPQAVATVVGVEAERIVQLARDFATAPSASVHMSTGANMGRQGTLAYWLVQMLSLVTGNLGRRGGNIYSPGYFAAATVGKPKQPDPFYPSEFGDMRRVVGSLPGNLLADHIEMGLVKGLICMSGNPLLSMAGENRLRSALASLEFLLVVDIYPNATSLLADYLLPATDWLERSDINSVSLGFQPEPYVQYTDAVVEPQFERKPEWWIFARIQQALGLPSLLDQDDADPMSRANRQLAPHGLSIDELRSRPSNTAILPLPDPGLVFELGVQLEDRKVDCFPALIRRGQDAFATIFDALRAEPEDTLKLITLRTNYMVNSWMHNLQALKREHVLDNPVHVHPADMARLGLEADSEVAVASKHGRVIARLRADEDLRPGVVAMTHGWGHGNNPQLTLASNHPGTNVNELLPSGPGSYDPLSNMAFMTGITVALSAV